MRLVLAALLFLAPVASLHAKALQPVSSDDARSGAFSNVCHLTVNRPRGGPRNSTGLLMGNGYLLTAAHNVYSPFYNKAKRIEVRCGIADASVGDPQQTLSYRAVAVAKCYFWKRYKRDYAVVRLSAPIKSALPVRVEAVDDRFAQPVRLAGYPGSNEADLRMDAKHLYAGQGKAIRDGKMLSYDIDTFRGNSGGPVWVERDGAMFIVGVHVNGAGQRGGARVVDAGFVTELAAMIQKVERRVTANNAPF